MRAAVPDCNCNHFKVQAIVIAAKGGWLKFLHKGGEGRNAAQKDGKEGTGGRYRQKKRPP